MQDWQLQSKCEKTLERCSDEKYVLWMETATKKGIIVPLDKTQLLEPLYRVLGGYIKANTNALGIG